MSFVFYFLALSWGILGIGYSLAGENMDSAMIRVGFSAVFFGIGLILRHLEEKE